MKKFLLAFGFLFLTTLAHARFFGSSGSAAAPAWVGPGFQGTTANGVNSSSAVICGIFYTPATVTVDSITVHIGTSAGNVDVGIYDTSGNRLASAGTTACPPAGRANIPLSATVTLVSGNYWMCLGANLTTSTFHSATATTTQYGGWQSCAAASTNFPLPLTLSFPCGNTSRLVDYNIWGHVQGGAF